MRSAGSARYPLENGWRRGRWRRQPGRQLAWQREANRVWSQPPGGSRRGRCHLRFRALRLSTRRSYFRPAEGQGQDRAILDRPLGQRQEVLRDRARGDDRVAPVIQPDQLREDLSAQAMSIAFDAVDGELEL